MTLLGSSMGDTNRGAAYSSLRCDSNDIYNYYLMLTGKNSSVPPRLLALIPLAVGINLAMGIMVAALSLPLFLDTVGTVMIAALAGPVAAVATGILSQVVFTLFSGNAVWLAFLPVQLAVALYAAFVARRGFFSSVMRAVGSGALLGIIAASLSWPIAYFAFGGVTAGGVAGVTAFLNGLGVPLGWAVYGASLSNDVVDKTVTFLLVRSLLNSLPKRMTARFPLARRSLGQAA